MRENPPTSIFIAPLRIRKSSEGSSARSPQDSTHSHREVSSRHEDEADLGDHLPETPRFHNYLRALYPFSPPSPRTSTTVTLPLNAGDIILVHSVHVNGWADGTLLDTGARGWLPTNYCEAYDYIAMRPLLRALTEFWDIVRCGSDANLGIFRNQDYMRGLVAGVRALLERSDCLTRESPMVREHEGIRRTRKSLLSDLAMLVKAAKQLQHLVTIASSQPNLDILLDDMLLKAFKIVTRAVLFFDVWSDHTPSALRSPNRLQTAFSQDFPTEVNETRRDSQSAADHRPSGSAPAGSRHSRMTSKRSSISSTGKGALMRRQSSITHRMSYSRATSQFKNPNLVSELLGKSYDDLLTVLASFLGSHMHSRSSSELLLTTQNAVRSCRQLFKMVDIVIKRGGETSGPLVPAKEAMYDAITELVHAAGRVFNSDQATDDGVVYGPEEAQHLVSAATACVSAAGRCVARTKAALEEIGDFEIEHPSRLLARTSGNSTPEPTVHDLPTRDDQVRTTLTPPTDPQDSDHMKSHRRVSPTQGMLTPPLSANTIDSPSTGFESVPPSPGGEPRVEIFQSSPLVTSSPRHAQGLAISTDFSDAVTEVKRHGSPRRAANGSGYSGSSVAGSHRRSDPSNLSTASTRVTSFHGEDNHAFDEPPMTPSTVVTEDGQSEDENDAEAEMLAWTFAQELIFNRDGLVVGGTLNALVERLTAHDSAPDATFSSTFYLTFRLFAKPEEFAQALVYRFEYVAEKPSIASPARLRVYNAFKGWMESHWRHDCDNSALPVIVGFAREMLSPVIPMAGKRLLELADLLSSAQGPAVSRVVSSMGKTTTSTAAYVDPNTAMPSPVISKSQLSALKTWKMGGSVVSIVDFDPLEIARQITLKTSQVFCSVLPEELLGTEWTKRSSSLAVNVRAMSTLSTDISNLVSDSVLQLEEPKKRAALIKQWIKIANKCLELHNYDTLMAIMASLDSTTLKRLRKTWEVVPQKTRNVLEELRKVVDISHNYSSLRQRVATQPPPCIPFLGVYLTDLTMVDSASPSSRALATDKGKISVINLEKHYKTAKIISELQRFQIPYRFAEVSELQTWMQDQLIRVRSGGERNFQLHYRRSLILEPKEMTRAAATVEPAPPGKDKDRFDFLNWTNLLKQEKSVPVSG